MARSAGLPRPTRRTRTGSAAERFVADQLATLGWTVLARNVRVGRSELDIVAVDPGPPAMLVVVEVRANRAARFGVPEDTVDRDKLRAVYRGAYTLRIGGMLPDGSRLPRLPLRVDVLAVELGPTLAEGVGGAVLRHLRGVIG